MPLSIVSKGVLGLAAFGALGAYEIAPPDPNGQTVFLERLAVRIESARQLPPQTHKTVSGILDRMSRQRATASRSADIEARRQLAIAKIEDVLRRRSQ
jgi:hypothetical protein